MWCVVLLAKGDVRNAVVPPTLTGIPDGNTIAVITKRALAPELIGTWKYDGMVLYLFGYKSGRANTENKHELPPPHDKILLFGDAVVFGMRDGKPVNFDSKTWPVFYEKAFGGFEDLDDDDDEDEDEDDEGDEEEEEADDAADDEEVDAEIPDEEEEEEEVKKKVVRVTKLKRGAKRLPVWYNNTELKPEAYDI